MAFPPDDPARASQPDAATASGGQPAARQVLPQTGDPLAVPSTLLPPAVDMPQAAAGATPQRDNEQPPAQGPDGWPDALSAAPMPPADQSGWPLAAVAGPQATDEPLAPSDTASPAAEDTPSSNEAQQKNAERSPAAVPDLFALSDAPTIESVDSGDPVMADSPSATLAPSAQPAVSSAPDTGTRQHDAPAFEVTPAAELEIQPPVRFGPAIAAATDAVAAIRSAGLDNDTIGPERPGFDDFLQRLRADYAARSDGNGLFSGPDAVALSASGGRDDGATAPADAQAGPAAALNVDWRQYDSMVEALVERTATRLAALVREQIEEALNEREFREAAHWRAVGG